MKILLVVIAICVLLLLAWLYLIAARRGGAQKMTAFARCYYAHRGLHDAAAGVPENSLPAFSRAVARGFGAELDVHLLRDGTLAVFHDSDLARMTGRAGALEELAAEELSACFLGGTEETIPLFADVLALFEGTGLPLIVELKPHGGNHAALCAATMALLDAHSVPYCVESFDPRCVKWLRENRGDVIRGQLSRDFVQKPDGLSPFMARVMTHLWCNVLSRPDFLAYRFDQRRRAPLRLCRAVFGAQIVYWTVHTQQELDTAAREGALVIFEGFCPQ